MLDLTIILDKMQRRLEFNDKNGYPSFTCIVLWEIDPSLVRDYQEWLKNSKYFDFRSRGTVTVKLDLHDHEGKFKMFSEFIEDMQAKNA